jgi:hypothetical protein
LFAASNGLERRYRPLIVRDADNDRHAVDRGEQNAGVEVAFRRGAFADESDRDLVVAAKGRCHRPAHGLRHLRRKIARHREISEFRIGIVQRHLHAVLLVAGIAIGLVHHIDDRTAAGDQEPLLAVGGEAHIVVAEREGVRDGNGLFAQATQEERRLALALGAEHAVFEDAVDDHELQGAAQRLRR